MKRDIVTPNAFPAIIDADLCWFDHFRSGDVTDPKFRQQVVDSLVNSVYLFEDKIVLNLNYTENGEQVTLSEVKSSILDAMGSLVKAPCF